MILNYKKYGQAGPHLIILHGLFGMLDNWQTLSTRFSAHCQVWALDQRNHGKSPHSDEIDYPILSNDLYDFCQQHQIGSAMVLGHSMGGKTAMQFALDHPDRVTRLIVADIGPKAYADKGQEALMEALQSLDLSQITRRNDADEALKAKIPDEGTRQFLLKNLAREGDGYVLKFNLDALARNYGKISAAITGAHPYSGPTLFISGEKSNYIVDADKPLILKMFPNAKFISIPGAGHWVHADNPDAFYDAVINNIQ